MFLLRLITMIHAALNKTNKKPMQTGTALCSYYVFHGRVKPWLHVQTGLSNHSTFVQTNLKQWLDGQTASVALAMHRLFICDFFIGLRASSRL